MPYLLLIICSLLACNLAHAELLAHWDFHDGHGLMLTDLSGKNDVSIKGATWSKKGDTHNSQGYSLLFDGVDDYVDLKSIVTDFPRGTKERSIIVWFSPSPKTEPLFIYGSEGKKYGSRRLLSASKTEVSAGFIGHIYGNNNLQLSGWHQLAVVVPAGIGVDAAIRFSSEGIGLLQVHVYGVCQLSLQRTVIVFSGGWIDSVPQNARTE